MESPNVSLSSRQGTVNSNSLCYSPEPWSSLTSQSSFQASNGPSVYSESGSMEKSYKSKRSLKEKLNSLIKHAKKIGWINSNETDVRLPFSGKLYRSVRRHSPNSWSSGYESADSTETPVILTLEREPRNFRDSFIIPEDLHIDEDSLISSIPKSTPEETNPLNLVETCFLDYTTPTQLLNKRLSSLESRKVPDHHLTLPSSKNFRVSAFDDKVAVQPQLPSPRRKPDVPQILITPKREPEPSLPIIKPAKKLKSSPSPYSSSTSLLPSKLPVPIPGLVRQRTFDSGISNNSSPTPSRREQLTRSLSPTFSLTSEPPLRTNTNIRRHASLGKEWRPAPRPRPLSAASDFTTSSPVSSCSSSHQDRHAKCFSSAHHTTVKPIRRGRVPPTALRIENEPKPRTKQVSPKITENWKNSCSSINEVPVLRKDLSTSPTTRIRNLILDEKYNSDLRLAKNSSAKRPRPLSLDAGSHSSVYVLDLSRSDLLREELVILLTSERPHRSPSLEGGKERFC